MLSRRQRTFFIPPRAFELFILLGIVVRTEIIRNPLNRSVEENLLFKKKKPVHCWCLGTSSLRSGQAMMGRGGRKGLQISNAYINNVHIFFVITHLTKCKKKKKNRQLKIFSRLKITELYTESSGNQYNFGILYLIQTYALKKKKNVFYLHVSLSFC